MLIGLVKGAGQTILGEWLRAQSPKSVEAVMSVNRDFVAQVAFLKLQRSGTNGASGNCKAGSGKRRTPCAWLSGLFSLLLFSVLQL